MRELISVLNACRFNLLLALALTILFAILLPQIKVERSNVIEMSPPITNFGH